jgi:hypothetical protein
MTVFITHVRIGDWLTVRKDIFKNCSGQCAHCSRSSKSESQRNENEILELTLIETRWSLATLRQQRPDVAARRSVARKKLGTRFRRWRW